MPTIEEIHKAYTEKVVDSEPGRLAKQLEKFRKEPHVIAAGHQLAAAEPNADTLHELLGVVRAWRGDLGPFEAAYEWFVTDVTGPIALVWYELWDQTRAAFRAKHPEIPGAVHGSTWRDRTIEPTFNMIVKLIAANPARATDPQLLRQAIGHNAPDDAVLELEASIGVVARGRKSKLDEETQRALTLLCVSTRKQLLSIAQFHLRDADRADEAVTDAFRKLWQAIATGRGQPDKKLLLWHLNHTIPEVQRRHYKHDTNSEPAGNLTDPGDEDTHVSIAALGKVAMDDPQIEMAEEVTDTRARIAEVCSQLTAKIEKLRRTAPDGDPLVDAAVGPLVDAEKVLSRLVGSDAIGFAFLDRQHAINDIVAGVLFREDYSLLASAKKSRTKMVSQVIRRECGRWLADSDPLAAAIYSLDTELADTEMALRASAVEPDAGERGSRQTLADTVLILRRCADNRTSPPSSPEEAPAFVAELFGEVGLDPFADAHSPRVQAATGAVLAHCQAWLDFPPADPGDEQTDGHR